MASSFELSFTNGLSARAVYAQTVGSLSIALAQLELQRSKPVLVVVGGASHLSSADYQRLTSLFTELLVPMAEELGMTVIDGGTNAGVMQLMGKARAACRASFPLVGIAPLGKIYLPHQPPLPQRHELEPHHSHFLIVPGQAWGAESPWIAKAAGLLAGAAPSLTLLLNGGNIALVDLRESIANHRPVVVMTGTGRLADEIEVALRNPAAEMRAGLFPVVYSGLIELSKTPAQLQNLLFNHLRPASAGLPLTSHLKPIKPNGHQPWVQSAFIKPA